MKKSISILSIVATLFIVNSAISQSGVIWKPSATSGQVLPINNRTSNTEGSIYIIEHFLPASINNEEKTYMLRYDAYQDEMEIDIEGVAHYLPKTYKFNIVFHETNKVYNLLEYDKKGKIEKGFFVESYIGKKISLLIQEKIEFNEEIEPSSHYEKYYPPKFNRINDQFYISYDNNSVSKLPNKSKDIIKLFGSKSKDVENYAKKNRLNFKEEKDLVMIFKYFDTL